MGIGLKLICLVLCALALVDCRELFIVCDQQNQEEEFYSEVFHDVDDGFYVELGGYDPFILSNTMNLYARGWMGLTVEASPTRQEAFHFQRPQSINLNVAISLEKSIMTLYESTSDDSISTVNQQLNQQFKKKNRGSRAVKVPAMTLGELCEHKFFKRPQVLIVDIEGMEYESLTTNYWNRSVCRPDMVLFENIYVIQVNLKNPAEILKQNGYVLMDRLGMDQVWVQKQLQTYYYPKINKWRQRFEQKKQLYTIKDFIRAINILTKQNLPLNHYHIGKSDVYIIFNRADDDLDLSAINRRSNLISEKKNRKVVILNFNPNKSFVLLQGQYTVEETKQSNLSFWLIKNQIKGNNIQFYVLDHHYQPQAKPTIINKSFVRNIANALSKPGTVQQKSARLPQETSGPFVAWSMLVLGICALINVSLAVLLIFFLRAGSKYSKLKSQKDDFSPQPQSEIYKNTE